MSLDSAIISAMLLDRKGGARNLSAEEAEQATSADGLLWLHLDFRKVGGERWLKEQLDIDPLVGDALMDRETRPRAMKFGDGIMFILRSLVTVPGADPEDLPVIRCWCEETRIVTMGTVEIKSVGQVQAFLDAGMGPKDAGRFVSLLTERMCQNMNPPLDLIEDAVESIHDATIAGNFETTFRRQLSELRRQAITMQRFVAPQRDAVNYISSSRLTWLGKDAKAKLRENYDDILMFLEDLSAAIDHAKIAQDDIENYLALQLNRKLYLLSLAAAIFLPLNLITSLLGINVAGIPGAQDPRAFFIVVGMLGAISVLQVLLFKKIKWM